MQSPEKGYVHHPTFLHFGLVFSLAGVSWIDPPRKSSYVSVYRILTICFHININTVLPNKAVDCNNILSSNNQGKH